jgi:hypothetical protein
MVTLAIAKGLEVMSIRARDEIGDVLRVICGEKA